MKLNKEFPRKLYLDTKVLVNGNKKKPRDLNLEKHIELSKWIQNLIDSGDITIPCCNENECKKPKAIDDYINLLPSGNIFQYINVIQNDEFDNSDLPITITIDNNEIDIADFTYEIFQPINLSYPIIKLIRGDGTNIENIDAPLSIKYKITNSCGESNWATLWLYPVWYDLSQINNLYIN